MSDVTAVVRHARPAIAGTVGILASPVGAVVTSPVRPPAVQTISATVRSGGVAVAGAVRSAAVIAAVIQGGSRSETYDSWFGSW